MEREIAHRGDRENVGGGSSGGTGRELAPDQEWPAWGEGAAERPLAPSSGRKRRRPWMQRSAATMRDGLDSAGGSGGAGGICNSPVHADDDGDQDPGPAWQAREACGRCARGGGDGDDSDDDGWVRDFFLKESVTDQEVRELGPLIADALDRRIRDLTRVLRLLEEEDGENETTRGGPDPSTEDDDPGSPGEDVASSPGDSASLVNEPQRGDGDGRDDDEPPPLVPRPYQVELARRAATENLIVHLGTGTGKTLVAILAMERHRRTVLVVPSVELAAQHARTLRGHPAAAAPAIGLCAGGKRRVCSLHGDDGVGDGTALSGEDTGNSPRRTRWGPFAAATPEELSRCRVVVGTHGAVLDLFGTYADLFFFGGDGGIELLVLDECHHCTGDSDYAVLMRDFYAPAAAKPRVLGLTASPVLLRAGGRGGGGGGEDGDGEIRCAADRFREPVEELERLMGSRIVSLECDKTTEHTSVPYLPASQLPIEDLEASICWEGLAPVRVREVQQLISLYADLGPLLALDYATALLRSVRVIPSEETPEQFRCALHVLESVIAVCERNRNGPSRGRTDKLLALEEVLSDFLDDPNEGYGIVFVSRRVTALALHHYFTRIQSSVPGGDRIDAADIRRVLRNWALDAEFDDGDDGIQFMDATDDPFLACFTPFSSQLPATDSFQFEDADDDPVRVIYSRDAQTCVESAVEASAEADPSASERESLLARRSGVIIGRGSPLFKRVMTLASSDLLRPRAGMNNVVQDFRERRINVLFATDVVEEGISVDSCSFVVAFDPPTGSKSYVQRKGRARRDDSKFLVFEPLSCLQATSVLDDLAKDDEALQQFLIERPSVRTENEFFGAFMTSSPPLSTQQDPFISLDSECEGDSAEILAVQRGVFELPNARLTLQAARKCLTHLFFSRSRDLLTASSRDDCRAHMPRFNSDSTRLYLPLSVSCRSIREVDLPEDERFHSMPSKKRKNALALMACVRLYKLGILSDRLKSRSHDSCLRHILDALPESLREDLLQPGNSAAQETMTSPDLLSQTCPSFPSAVHPELGLLTSRDSGGAPAGVSRISGISGVRRVFLYKVNQANHNLARYHRILGSDGVFLAIVTDSRLPDVTPFSYHHRGFGEIVFALEPPTQYELCPTQLESLSDFFSLLFDIRWKRKRTAEDSAFQYRENGAGLPHPLYRIALVSGDCNLLWDRMHRALREFRRTTCERRDAVRNAFVNFELSFPRLWSPIYSERTMYVVYGPTSCRCGIMFPRSEDGTQDIKTYSDYYRVKKEIDVPSDSILFQAQALWHLPSRRTGLRAAIKEFEDDDETSENGYTLCHGLVSLMLASQACMESRITDPGLYLLCTCLPQFLFQMERCLCAHALIEHTSKILPILSGFLRGLPLTEVVSVLSAKSCQENASYERLEWLGDAVLKLVQTDSIIKSKHLRDSVRQIDEGSLDCLRSMLGSNDCLARRCKRLGIDRFIMTTSLSRSHWLPTPLALSATEAGPIDCSPASCKVYADVVEAILGLAYMHGGYSLAVGVADELQITIPWDDANMGTQRGDCDTAISVDSLLRAVERFTGHRFSCGSEIVLEALTHPTAQSLFTGSYQQLEWVGDAVLCLAVREWVFQNFPECDVKFMVQVETVLVNNETLAFFSMKNGLYEHLLHNDGTLTMRLDAYERSIDHLGRGLWATQPPKAAADVVESVLGAVHIHGGFQCGQRAVLTVLRPVMKMVASLDSYSTERLICHPRKSLLELGDNKVLTIRLDEEDVFSCEYPKAYVLDGGRFTSVHREGKRTIASIDCLGTLVVSVADDIPCSAENRACTLVLTVLRNESGLFRRFCEARALYVNAIQTGGKWRERAIRERL